MGRRRRVAVVVLGVSLAVAACAVAIAVMMVRSALLLPLPPGARPLVIPGEHFVIVNPNFSHAVSFPDGSHGELRQTDIQPSERQGSEFLVDVVHPQAKTLHGMLHLSPSAADALETCPGGTLQERYDSARDALVAWVREHGLKPDFEFEVVVESGNGKPCRVSLFPQQPTKRAVRVGANGTAPKQIKYVRPVYPKIAQTARVQGVVTIDAVIGPDGRVQNAMVLRSIPLLDDAAAGAVRQWVYTPTLVDGVAVSVIMTVRVNFTLP